MLGDAAPRSWRAGSSEPPDLVLRTEPPMPMMPMMVGDLSVVVGLTAVVLTVRLACLYVD